MGLSSTQINALNSGNPNALSVGAGVGDLLSDIYSQLSSGNFGIKNLSADIDALTLGGGAFTYDPDSSGGLNFAYKAGRAWVEGTGYAAIAASSVGLSASSTNYVEASAAGAISKNTVGFSQDKLPLYVVITGPATITSVTPWKPLLRVRPTGGYPGAVLSTAASTKMVQVPLGTVSATASFLIHAPSHAATLVKAALLVDTTVGTDAANIWTPTLTNKAGGGGTNAMLATGNGNTNNATGGSAFTAFSQRVFAVNPTAGNVQTAAGDCLQCILTKASAAPNLTNAVLLLEFSFAV